MDAPHLPSGRSPRQARPESGLRGVPVRRYADIAGVDSERDLTPPSRVLGWSGRAKILQPESLQEMVAEKLQLTLELNRA